MSQDSRDTAAQREVARIALDSVEGFALAGSGAIREHGVIDRPTEDVDLFTANADEDAFSVAVDHVTARLRSSGCEVELTRRAEHFARLHVVTADGVQLDVDLGVGRIDGASGLWELLRWSGHGVRETNWGC